MQTTKGCLRCVAGACHRDGNAGVGPAASRNAGFERGTNQRSRLDPAVVLVQVGDAVTVTQVPAAAGRAKEHVVVEWEGGALPDLLADATTAILLQARPVAAACGANVSRLRLVPSRLEVVCLGPVIGCLLLLIR